MNQRHTTSAAGKSQVRPAPIEVGDVLARRAHRSSEERTVVLPERATREGV